MWLPGWQSFFDTEKNTKVSQIKKTVQTQSSALEYFLKINFHTFYLMKSGFHVRIILTTSDNKQDQTSYTL